MRLFIALDVPENVRQWLSDRQEELKRFLSPSGLRWTPPEQWHVTLRFLGECPESKISAILIAMKHAAGATVPFSLSFSKPGTFSGPRMGVLWLGVETGLDPMKCFVDRLNQSLETEGFPVEKRPFRGHITLARSRAKIPSSLLRDFPLPTPCPESRIDSLHLYQSTLSAGGALYTRLHTVKF